MALGIYIEATGSDVDGAKWRVRIYKEGYVGSVNYMEPTSSIATLTYSPTTDDVSSPLVPSSASIYLYAQSSSEEALIEDMLTSHQANFYVTIEKDANSSEYTEYLPSLYASLVNEEGGEVVGQDCMDAWFGWFGATTDASIEDWRPYWKGVVMQEQFDIDDTSYPTMVTIEAIDGLGFLKTVEFTENTGTVSPKGYRYVNMATTLCSAIAEALPLELWGDDEPLLDMTQYWFDSSQTYGALVNPFETLVSNEVYFKVPNNDEKRLGLAAASCYRVVQAFAVQFLSRVYMAEGRWKFEQIEAGLQVSPNRSFYSTAFDYLGTAAVDTSVTIDQTRAALRLAGGKFTYYPAAYDVLAGQKTFAVDDETSVLLDVNMGTGTGSASFTYGVFSAENNGQQQFLSIHADSVNCVGKITFSSAQLTTMQGWIHIRPIWEVEIKYDDLDSSTTYYYEGTGWGTTASANGGWKTTAVKSTLIGPTLSMKVPTGSSYTASYSAAATGMPNFIQLSMTPLPVDDGILTVSVFTGKFYTRGATGGFVDNTANFSGFDFINGDTSFYLKTSFDVGEEVTVSSVVNATSNIANGEQIQLGVAMFGDGMRQYGTVQFENSGEPSPTGNWRYRDEAQNLNLTGLLVAQRLSYQSKVSRQFSGQLMYRQGYSFRPIFDGSIWFPMEWSYSLGLGSVEGLFRELNEEAIPTTVSDDLAERTFDYKNFGKLTTGKVGNVFNAPVIEIGGQLFGIQNLGPIYINDSDELEVPDPVIMQSAQRNSYREVTATASGSTTADATTTVILVSWSGSTGTFTLSIPDPAEIDGGTIEIIFDDTFEGSGATDVVIDVEGGASTIKGAASVTLSDDYDRLFLRAINGEYW